MSLLPTRNLSIPPLSILRPNQKPLLLTAILALTLTPLLTQARTNYHQWRALGRGGPPYNLLGWLIQSLLHPFTRSDTRHPIPAPYKSATDLAAALYGPEAARSYLAAWARGSKRRSGSRPDVPTFVAPQRQTTEKGGLEDVVRQKGFLVGVAEANPGVFVMRDSGLEGPLHRGLFLRWFPGQTSTVTGGGSNKEENERDRITARLGRGSRGEFAHVHGEGSTHVTLSTVDAAALIEAGWAERHKLSGVGGRRAYLPFGYVLLYAPRDDEEFEFWREVVLAAARYAAEGSGVEVVVPGF